MTPLTTEFSRVPSRRQGRRRLHPL